MGRECAVAPAELNMLFTVTMTSFPGANPNESHHLSLPYPSTLRVNKNLLNIYDVPVML